jgi:hypothetical protein
MSLKLGRYQNLNYFLYRISDVGDDHSPDQRWKGFDRQAKQDLCRCKEAEDDFGDVQLVIEVQSLMSSIS